MTMVKAELPREMSFLNSKMSNPELVTEKVNVSTEKTISEACQQGNLEYIKLYHGYGHCNKVKLSELDENGWCALHYASKFNQIHIVEYLVGIGIDVNIVTEDDATPLHIAVRHNCHDVVRYLLKQGASPTMKNYNGECVVHFVGKRGDKKLVDILSSNHQTDFTLVDKNQRTPLHHACFYSNTVVCETLLNRGADLEAKTVDGLTPLHIAVIGRHEEVVKLLIKRAKERNLKMKEFINVSDKNSTTPLHLSARGGQYNIMEILLRHGADVNAQRNLSGRGFSALHLAAVSGDLKMCQLLVTHNATVDIEDCDGCTALHRAAARNHEAVVIFLLDKGSTLTNTDKNGLTPFLHAVQEGHTMSAEIILKKKQSQMYQRTKKAHCCIHLAVMNRCKPTLMMLLRNGGSNYTNAIDSNGRTPLHYAAATGDSELVRILIDQGSNPDMFDSHSQTPLHLACKTNSLKCVKLILDKSTASLNFLDDTGRTALHISCQNGNALVTNYLLKHGADVSFSDIHGDTALHLAVRSSSIGICTSLLDYYAPCDLPNADGNTPLHLAAKGDCPLIVVKLLDKKSNTQLKNKKDKTFFDLAIDNTTGEVLEAIMNHHSMVKTLDTSKRNEAITKMVHNHPKVTASLLDQGMTFSEHSQNDKEFKITYDFHLLDPGPCAGRSRFITLQSMVEFRQEEILSHPLVKKMLSRKWTTFGRNIYILGLFLFLLFHITLSSVIIAERRRATFHGNVTTYTKEFRKNHDDNIVLMAFLYIAALFNIAKEIFQMFFRGLRYFTNIENLIEIMLYFMTLVFLTPYLYISADGNNPIPNVLLGGRNWQFGILAVFFSWLNFVLYLRSYMFPTLGVYITMFFEIVKTFLRVSSVILLFLLGYANVFYVIFPMQETHNSVWKSLMTSMVMMIGEIGYRETLIDTSGSTLLPFPDLSFIIFSIFLVTMPIILANLLIGLAVGDIDGVQNNANMSLIAMLVDYVTEIEQKLPMFIQKRCYEARYTEKPNEPLSKKVKLFQRFLWEVTGDPSCNTHQAVTQVMRNRFQKGKFEDSQKIAHMETRLKDQQHSIRQLKKLVQNQTKLLQDLTVSFGLRNEDDSPTVMEGLSTIYGYRTTYS